MTLGALIDSGVPLEHIEKEIAQLGLSDYQIRSRKVIKNHIEATKVDIDFNQAGQPDRKYPAIVSMIKNSGLKPSIKQKSLEAFQCLGEAEARIHGRKLKDIHFHEIGAVDSIIDLIGSIIGFEYLEIEKVFTSPIPLGTGFTRTEHGTMPVPSPAALEVLKNYPVVHRDAQFELTTPTGATIVKILSEGQLPEGIVFIPEKTGYGAGSKDVKAWPNVLRLIVGETSNINNDDQLIVIEANLDDQNPEIYPFVSDLLFEAGVNEVFLTPVIMKKGRPGTQITILTTKLKLTNVESILFKETSTIGFRYYPVDRKVMTRKNILVETKFGRVEAKQISLSGQKKIVPEFETCKKIAREKKIPLIDVYREIEKLNG